MPWIELQNPIRAPLFVRGRMISDMVKDYDQVEWDFLGAVLEAFGFHRIFIIMVNKCVSSASLSILLNGSILRNRWPILVRVLVLKGVGHY